MIVYGGPERRPIALGPELARGGQGSIHALTNEDNRLAKIYFRPDPADAGRLLWMLHHPPPRLELTAPHTTVAWPQIPLYAARKGGGFVGYVMPRVRDAVLWLDLITPKIRLRKLPGFNWKYLHRTARNLAAAVGIVHHSEYVVGDLNESNILVTPDALVTLIDVDSFQTIEIHLDQRIIHLCPVGKPEYTAPELQGAELRHVLRTNEHDSFALAVLIFQLLMSGRHPYQSIWHGAGEAPSIGDKIQRGLFPYGPSKPALVAPPPDSTLDVLHPSLRSLILRCFLDGQAAPPRRPTPDEWETALAEAELHIVYCRFGHCYSGHLEACPECKYQRIKHERQRRSHRAAPVLAAAPAHVASVSRPLSPQRSRTVGMGGVVAILILVGLGLAAVLSSIFEAQGLKGVQVTAGLATATGAVLGLVAPTAPAATVSPVATAPVSLRTATPQASTTAAQTPTLISTHPLPDVQLYTHKAVNLYLGPATFYPVLGVLLTGMGVYPLCQTYDSAWLYVQVVETAERGWLETSAVNIPGRMDSLAIAYSCRQY